MSLPAAMLELANEMEALAAQQDPTDADVKLWVKAIRMCVKAAEGTEAKKAAKPYDVQQDLAHRFANQHDLALAQRALERQHARLQESEIVDSVEDMIGPRFARCVGGPEDGVQVNIDPNMQAGKLLHVGGLAYKLQEDGALHYVGAQ